MSLGLETGNDVRLNDQIMDCQPIIVCGGLVTQWKKTDSGAVSVQRVFRTDHFCHYRQESPFRCSENILQLPQPCIFCPVLESIMKSSGEFSNNYRSCLLQNLLFVGFWIRVFLHNAWENISDVYNHGHICWVCIRKTAWYW